MDSRTRRRDWDRGIQRSRDDAAFSIYQTDLAATPPTEQALVLSTLTLSQVSAVAGAITILVNVDRRTGVGTSGGAALTLSG